MKKFFILLIFPIGLLGQNTIGLPDVNNYFKSVYKAGTQNWDVKQDKNGIIYIANNEGLLSFDGKYWTVYPLPNKTIVRSVDIGPDNKIYVGGQDELGYFMPGPNGQLQYTSLVHLIPYQYRTFGDVWDIVSYKGSVFFRTDSKIFKVNAQAAIVYAATGEWSFMSTCNGQLYAHDIQNGLYSFTNNVWTPIVTINALPNPDPITAILPLKQDTLLIATLKNGLYRFANNGYQKIETPAMQQIQSQRIYDATLLNNGWIALATTIGGVYIVNQQGELIQRFSKSEGLQNNNVLSIQLDKQNNLWLGLDNGVDCVAYNSAVKHISPNTQDASGYTAIIHENILYIGTSSGLFSTPLQVEKDLSFSKGLFTQVNNTTGQNWSLSDINGQLLMGHHEGAFVINNNNATLLSSNPGFWNFVPLSNVFPASSVIAGNYKGVTVFQANRNSFSSTGTIPNFIESSRFIAIDNIGNIWVSHPYHGVYKISPSADSNYITTLYTAQNGLPFTLNNHVYKIKNEVVVATETGVYVYKSSKDSFEPSAYYAKIFGEQSLRYLKEDVDGNIWFIHEKTLGVVDMSTGVPAVSYLPELNNKMLSGFEFLYPVNANNIFLGGEKGFYHINYEKYKKTIAPLTVRLKSVTIFNQKDSVLFGGYFKNINEQQIQDLENIPELSNEWKNILFQFSAPMFGQQSKLEYSYRLKGFDKNWSEWSDKTEKEYTNLPAGNYSFEIKARNNLGNESAAIGYQFIVLPRWYRTNWAYGCFSFALVLLVVNFYKRQRKKLFAQQKKYEEEQEKISYLHQLEIDKAESELVTLRNEKLQSEIDFKNSELATSAMHLVQKGELIAKIKTELNHIMKAIGNEKTVAELKKMIKVLSEDDKMDKDWEHFAQHFDKVNSDFVLVLKEKHSNITANEIKLCTYLRMNLSSKEIAQLMNISVRGIEISRYRLRKKLGIGSEVSLFDYLINLSNKEA